MVTAPLKSEHCTDDTGSVAPIYPRPIYQYDPNGGPLPVGFSAMNLSVKLQAAAAAQQAAVAAAAAAAATLSYKSSSSSPLPPPLPSRQPVIDLSTTSVSSSTSQTYSSSQYSAAGRHSSSSPPPPQPPHLTSNASPSRLATSPHEPSPQTLDLSVSRLGPPQQPPPPSSGRSPPSYDGVRFGRPPRSPQTEPVDFSAAPPRPMPFNMIGGGVVGGGGGPTSYSRESTPDSGGSHYMDNYRDHGGKFYFCFKEMIIN